MNHRYPVQLTTLEEDFRAIGLLPQREISEVDDSTDPRDIPSPDPSTAAGNDDSQPTPARHKYAKQLKPKQSPDDTNDHDDPLEAGATQAKKGGSYKAVSGGKEASIARSESVEPKGYQLLKNKIMKGASDNGKTVAVAQGLAPVAKIAGMSKKESANISRASELVNEVEALLNGSQVSEDYNNLAHGFGLISENCSLLADRLVDLAEHYNVDKAISAMESLYNNAIEAAQIVEMKTKKKKDDEDDDDEDDDAEEALESFKEAFRLMTLQLMDAVEAYDATITEASKDDDDDDDSDDDDSDDDSDDDDDDSDDDSEKGGIAARMAKLKAGKGKGPFGK